MGEAARLRALPDHALAQDLRRWPRLGLVLVAASVKVGSRVRVAARGELGRRRRGLDGPASDLTQPSGTVGWDGRAWREER